MWCGTNVVPSVVSKYVPQCNDTDAQVTGGIEPVDFNVTSALLDWGVNVTELPAAALVELSSDSACSIAVSQWTLRWWPWSNMQHSVQLTSDHLWSTTGRLQ